MAIGTETLELWNTETLEQTFALCPMPCPALKFNPPSPRLTLALKLAPSHAVAIALAQATKASAAHGQRRRTADKEFRV